MSVLKGIREVRGVIANQTISHFPELVRLVETGIELLRESNWLVKPRDGSVNLKTSEGASKVAVWRFLSTLPISTTWCLDIALCGDYLISKNILRLALEESIKLIYYSAFPEHALKQIARSRSKDVITIPQMLKRIELAQEKGLLELYGNLSNFYAHANLNLPPELIYEEEGKVLIGGGSRFLPAIFEAICQQLIILLGNALKFVLLRFPELKRDHEWMERFKSFIEEGHALIHGS